MKPVYDLLNEARLRVEELPNDTMNVSMAEFYRVYETLLGLPLATRIVISKYVETRNVFSKETWRAALEELMEFSCAG